MKNNTLVFMIVTVVVLTCFNASLPAQENNNINTIKNILDRLPNPAEGRQGQGKTPCSEIVQNLKSSDVSILMDIFEDRKIASKLRSSAFEAAICINPDRAYDRIVQFAVRNIPTYNYAEKTGDDRVVGLRNYIINYYKQTNNDELLKPFRTLYLDKTCSDGCKFSILMLLTNTDSKGNIEFYKNIIDNPSTPAHRAHAVFGLAHSGSMDSLPYLKEMASFLFKAEIDYAGDEYYPRAINALGELSSKNYVASMAIQEVIGKTCAVDPDQYGRRLKNSDYVLILFDELKRNSEKENRQYLENFIVAPCKYPHVTEWAQKALDLLGSKESIDKSRHPVP
jgi:hypothetical protein